MHLCRGNCLSQVLPGTFIVSPDTEYSTPFPSSGTVCSLASSREGASLAGREVWLGRGGEHQNRFSCSPYTTLEEEKARGSGQGSASDLSAWTPGTGYKLSIWHASLLNLDVYSMHTASPTCRGCTLCPAHSLVLDPLILPLPLYNHRSQSEWDVCGCG